MSKHLILVKHSLPEVNENVPAREWKLSREGRLRAEHLVKKLANYQPEILISSPEPKAMETAEIIGNFFGLPVQIVEDLHEHKRSTVGYLPNHDFERAVSSFFAYPDRLVIGEETASQAHARFSGAVSSALEENENKTVVIVAHGTVISLFVSRLTGQSGYGIWSALGLPGAIVMDMKSLIMISLENVE